jgi:HD-GYP domain-containing protein (c-di-GMP phosphodiesterase class II)
MEARQATDRDAALAGATVYRPIDAITSGAVLALPILAEDGRVLVKAGTPLNERYAASLAKRGIAGLYVLDGKSGAAAGGSTARGFGEPQRKPADYQAEIVRRFGRVGARVGAGEQLLGRGRLGLGSERLAILARSLAELLGKVRGGADGPIISTVLADAGRLVLGEVMAGFRRPFWVPPIEAGDCYEVVHPIYSALLAVRLGAALNLREEDLQRLGTSGVLMDVGMARLPVDALAGAGPLDDEVWALVRRHPEESVRLLRASGMPGTVLQTVADHHERWDGGGYPRVLKGTNVFRSARLLNVAATYVALISPRPYRAAFTPHEAMEYLSAYSGEWFDPALVQLLIATAAAYGEGARVELDDGSLATVVKPHPGQPGRPLIKLDDGTVVDMAATGQLHRSIVRVEPGS